MWIKHKVEEDIIEKNWRREEAQDTVGSCEGQGYSKVMPVPSISLERSGNIFVEEEQLREKEQAIIFLSFLVLKKVIFRH